MSFSFRLSPLEYDAGALEPHIDQRTMEIHHGRHHAAYTTNLNNALRDHPGLHGRSAEDLVSDLGSIPDAIRAAVRNNGGGYLNHNLFWEILSPGGASAPEGDLAKEIDRVFGGFDEFKERFSAAGMARFGSGWAWLSVDGSGDLALSSTANQDTPLMEGDTPILGVDVWEHAYYLRYQNRRPAYLAAIWSVVNWTVVADKFGAAR